MSGSSTSTSMPGPRTWAPSIRGTASKWLPACVTACVTACSVASHSCLAGAGPLPAAADDLATRVHPALSPESPCFPVQRILLSVPSELPASVRERGASALPQDRFAFAQAWLDRYRGACLGRQGVETLAKGVSQAILQRGYVTTRVLVPEQDLGSGVLRLALIPGVVGELRFAEADAEGSWKTAFPTGSGELLRLPDLEQGLEQMKRVGSQDVGMQIVPTGMPGVSDVVISITRGKRWSVAGSVDDAGSPSTGRQQGNLNLMLDNPLGIHDQFSVGYGRALGFAANGSSTASWNGSYSLPFGYWTATLSAYHSGYRQQVAGVNQTFVFRGESQAADLKLQRVVHRSRDDVMTLHWRLSRRFGKSYIEDTEIVQQRRNNTVADFGLSDRHHWGGAHADASLIYRQGVGGLGAQPDSLAADAGPAWRFRMVLADATLSLPLSVPGPSMPLTYVTTLRGQFTNHRLYLVDALSIGGRQTVRGFDGDTTLAGETGFHWRNELQWPISGTGQWLYSGLDYGRVYGPSAAALAGTQLAGAVIGLRGGLASRFGTASYDLFVGTPVYKPSHFETAAVTGGFQILYQY